MRRRYGVASLMEADSMSRGRSLLRLASLALAALSLLLPGMAKGVGEVMLGELRGAVSPATAEYLGRVLAEARERRAGLVVFTLDTPGGLDSAMRRMIQDILASPVPVALFVHPAGARAASAGTYLLYASHVAAMTPGTNLGAATPVAIGSGSRDQPAGKDEGKRSAGAMEEKVIQDAAAYIRGLAQWRGRNAEWAETAVRQAASLPATEASRIGVVDLVADDVPALLARLEGRPVKMAGGKVQRLAIGEAGLVRIGPNWKERLLASIADPNIALVLLMVGVYGLLFEFMSPGLAVPGVLGGISLLLALYGLALLPVNGVGVALIFLGIGLMAAEIFAPSFGILGLGGIAAFAGGAVMLVDPDLPGLSISWEFLLPFVLAISLAAVAVAFLVLRSRQAPPVSGREMMVGAPATALEDIDGEGWVQAFGERWRGRSSAPLSRGGAARIVAIDGLTLIVEPAEGEKR